MPWRGPTPEDAQLRQRVGVSPVLGDPVGFLWHQEDFATTLRDFDLEMVATVGSEVNCRMCMEWMVCGVALLATRIGVLPDRVEEAQTGYLAPPACASAVAENIVYSVRQPAEVRRLGGAARRRVLVRSTLAQRAAAHEALIRELVPRKSPELMRHCPVSPAPTSARIAGGGAGAAAARLCQNPDTLGAASFRGRRLRPARLPARGAGRREKMKQGIDAAAVW
jgi:hypothetical protein